MQRLSLLLAVGLAVGGCSIVYDPSVHMGGARMDGGGVDGGRADGGVDGGPMGVPLEDFCPALADAFCTNAERCCMEGVTPRPAFDRTRCLSSTTTGCSGLYGLTATRSEIDYDPVAAYDALQRGLALVEACDVELQDFYVQRDGVFGGIAGTIAGGLDCTPVDESNQIDVIVAVLSCTGGQVCQRIAAGDWRCSAPGADGASCTLAFDCASGRCENVNGFRTTGHCGPGEPAMSVCAAGDECESLTCVFNLGRLRSECAPQTQDNVYCQAAADGG
jgi:hypothetical protein